MTAPVSDDTAAELAGAAQPAPAPAPTEESTPPITAEMLRADPRITHDVIELTEPYDPTNTFEA